MSVNSSSAYNNFLDDSCSTVDFYINIGFDLLKVILIVPLCTLVLCVAHQRWRQQRSFKTASHADIITYHMVVIEPIWILGGFCYLSGTYTNDSLMITVGLNVRYTTCYAGIFLHLLTCVERYLAVVHPITYLGLRNARGVKIRNISIGCTWLLSFGMILVRVLYMPNNITIQQCVLVISIIIISSCSLSVLYVLICSGPRERVREKELVNQTKQRAFYTITAILGMFWLWLVGLFVNITVSQYPQLNTNIKCVLDMFLSLFNLPSHLVLPLLYLQRAGKLKYCFYKNK
ncbi:unnamed protein product [Oreochromis niloticus]|nr:unnamed protein product [Mustela putorius furo]